MRRTSTEPPVLSFCLITRNCADTVETTLLSIRARAPNAEIIVVDTMSSDFPTENDLETKALQRFEMVPGDPIRDLITGFEVGIPKTVQICKRYADVWVEYAGPKDTWTREMYAFDDAAAARNKALSLATGRWTCWIDSDDELVGPEEAERLLKLNGHWQTGPRERVVSDAGKPLTAPLTLEEILLETERRAPQLQVLWCPYLYQSDADGRAIIWQERERFVKNNGEFEWKRSAHEVLVAKDPTKRYPQGNLPTLLFVHRKKWDLAAMQFSLQRHWAILLKEYEGGERNLQSLLYLENYSMALAPQRQQEFIRAAYDASNTLHDRARVLVRAANFSAKNGFFMDALEAFAGAQALTPHLPDPWFAGANVMASVDNHAKAVEWYGRGLQAEIGNVNSDVTPRDHLIMYRLQFAMESLRLAKQVSGDLPRALAILRTAVQATRDAAGSPTAGPDRNEASSYSALLENELDALETIDRIHKVWQHLVKNDETIKARELLKTIPHTLADHPLTASLEAWAQKLDKHLTDDEAYAHFYDVERGGAPTAEEVITPDRMLSIDGAQPRVHFIIAQLRDRAAVLGRPLRVLEIGPFDGNVAIPIMSTLDRSVVEKYAVLEAQLVAIGRLRVNAERLVPDGAQRFEFHHGTLAEGRDDLQRDHDVVLFCEVIEHVPDPSLTITDLLDLAPHGRVIMSTPWGSYDRGHPFNVDSRDPRGHVRAMLPRDMDIVVREAGGRILTLEGTHAPGNNGDTMHVMIESRYHHRQATHAPPVVFAVAGALWDWNASTVLNTGMGASESSIVYLAKQLAKDGRRVEVYGPLPKYEGLTLEEVRDGVHYWPREQLRKIDPKSLLVVSRAPSWGATIPHPKERKILWLQDTHYADLTPEVADQYARIVCVSEWHRQVTHELSKIPLEKIVVLPNFLVPENQETPASGWPTREKHRLIYSSSPDRGLITLLKLWPAIRELWSDATLGIFYGWEGCIKLGSLGDPGWSQRYRAIRQQFLELRNQPGVEEYGRVNHKRLAVEFRRADVWCYPTGFAETACATALEARAGGAIPVTSPFAALNETAASALTRFIAQPEGFDTMSTGVGVEKHPGWEKYKTAILDSLEGASLVTEIERSLMSDSVRDTWSLPNRAAEWIDLLSDPVNATGAIQGHPLLRTGT